MKIREVRIRIKSLDVALDDFVSVSNQIQAGKSLEPRRGIYLADAATARAIFTDSRLAIIRTLKSKEPKSIYALAKILKRDFKNVYNDISFLSQLGLVAIEESKSGRKQKKPVLCCDRILFEMVA